MYAASRSDGQHQKEALLPDGHQQQHPKEALPPSTTHDVIAQQQHNHRQEPHPESQQQQYQLQQHQPQPAQEQAPSPNDASMALALARESPCPAPLLITPTTRTVPAFLNKLYNMVSDPSTNDLICWSENGDSFLVTRSEDLAREVLPKFYKTSHFSSFVRQLNMYGFHKIPHLQSGALNQVSQEELWEFSNQHFIRDQPDLLCLITRKRGADNPHSSLLSDELSHKLNRESIDINSIISEIHAIKSHQAAISADLQQLRNDNIILWQDHIASREHYQRQQETIDKILRFLASVYSGDNANQLGTPPRPAYLLEGVSFDYGSGINENGDFKKMLDNPTNKEHIGHHSSASVEDLNNLFSDVAKSPLTVTPAKIATNSSIPSSVSLTKYNQQQKEPGINQTLRRDQDSGSDNIHEKMRRNSLEAAALEEKIQTQDDHIEQLAEMLGLNTDLFESTDWENKLATSSTTLV